MQSRCKKFRKSFDNYQQAIQKQLNDDFQVYEYLNLNKLQGNNIDEYLKLYDSLQVQKNQKKKKYESMKVSYVQMSSESLDKTMLVSNIQNWGGQKEEFLYKYEQIQIKISNQFQIKNNLWKQILEAKKSLNLLKGDIGHLVSRNQTAKLLQSKMSKVKIVGDDQLKRVSMAFVKDKDQLKVRGQMQKKFHKKLKNVSMFEDTTLSRLKKNYLDTMVKKKEIHDRLNYIEKISASINQSDDKEKIKNQINKNTLELYYSFIKLSNLIEKVSQIEKQFGHTSEEIFDFVAWLRNEQNYSDHEICNLIPKSVSRSKRHIQHLFQINSSDLQMINKQKLQGFEKQIKNEHIRIVSEIESKITSYDMQMKRSQELISKLQKCNQEIEKIESSLTKQIGIKYLVTKEIRQQYFNKLRRFIQCLKTLFVLLEYIEKNINYTTFKDKPFLKHFSDHHFKSFTDHQNTSGFIQTLKIPRQYQALMKSDKSLMWKTKNYISELYKTYSILLKQQQSYQKLQYIPQNMFEDLKEDVNAWLLMIQDYFKTGQKTWNMFQDQVKKQVKGFKVQKQSSKLRDSRLSQIKIPKIGFETQQQEINQIKEQNQFNFQNYKRHHTVHKDENISRHHSYSSLSAHSRNVRAQISSIKKIPLTNLINSHQQRIVNIDKLKNASQHNYKAQRIKFLQDLDKDYYKMLKSTLTMEKQNTRKNYQFLRTFKRAKYSSRDQILQQKRFQCSFSMLFAGNKNKRIKERNELQGKKSIFFRNQNLQKRISRLYQSRKLLDSSKIIKISDLCESKVSQTDKVNKISDLNQSKMSELDKRMDESKQNLKKMNKEKNKEQQLVKSRHKLSIQMKDILNLM